jgi:hypothetical protein
MKSVIIKPSDKKEFDAAISFLKEFGKERKRLSLEDDVEISFAFLMKETDSTKEIADKNAKKKN